MKIYTQDLQATFHYVQCKGWLIIRFYTPLDNPKRICVVIDTSPKYWPGAMSMLWND